MPFQLLLVALSLMVIFTACQSEPQAEQDTELSLAADSLPSLQAQLDEKREAFVAQAAPDLVEDFEQGVRDVAGSGVLTTALAIGDTVPAFALPNAHGESVQLDSLLTAGPVVITWYRGGWCPYCNLQLQALQTALPQIQATGGQLVAISPELPDSSLSTEERNALAYPVLSDLGNRVAHEFGITYTLPVQVQKRFAGRLDIPAYNGDSSQTLPLAVTYVVAKDRTIAYAFVDADYRKRAEPAAIIGALRRLQDEK